MHHLRAASRVVPRNSLQRVNYARSFSTVKVSVNGTEIDVPAGCTVLHACETAGVHVPRFCYHDRLSIHGNCRMCLVEVEKSPKPVASCAMPVMPNMKIKTNTPIVSKAREGVMEFLLANHPLDCPICDQGGECDLQDQSMKFGSDRSRFREIKRTVEDKNIGPFVKTVMTRCIHCTRCVRFAAEVAGVPVMGATGRGNSMEIGTYVPKYLDSEISGNVIDLCPVGALTSKPFAFTSRPWELDPIESIDVTDAVGSNIRLDTRGAEVMRVLPRLNEAVNEEWISDKTRFSYDGLKRQRLDVPYKKQAEEYVPATWEESLTTLSQQLSKVNPNEVLCVVGDHADAESIYVAKEFFSQLGIKNIVHQQTFTDNVFIPSTQRSDYLFNSKFENIDECDLLLCVNSNLRMEAAVLNARVRRCVKQNGLDVYTIGPQADLAFKHTHLGNSAQILSDIAANKHEFAAKLAAAKRPVIIVGMGALTRSDAAAVLSTVNSFTNVNKNLLTDSWNGFNILHTSASQVACLDLGIQANRQLSNNKYKFVWLLGADNVKAEQLQGAYVVYQGSHGDVGASLAHQILPSTAFSEKTGTYVNAEGRVQSTLPAVGALGEARDDWMIFRALSEVMNNSLPYTTLDEVRSKLVQAVPHFAKYDTIVSTSSSAPFTSSQSLENTPFQPYITNFFMTDAICRSSKNMAKGSQQLPVSRNSYVA